MRARRSSIRSSSTQNTFAITDKCMNVLLFERCWERNCIPRTRPLGPLGLKGACEGATRARGTMAGWNLKVKSGTSAFVSHRTKVVSLYIYI